MKNLFIKILRLLVVVLVLVSGSLGYVIFEDTLAPWWIPVGMAIAVAAVTFPFYKKWRWLTENESKTLNLICHFLCVGVVAYGKPKTLVMQKGFFGLPIVRKGL